MMKPFSLLIALFALLFSACETTSSTADSVTDAVTETAADAANTAQNAISEVTDAAAEMMKGENYEIKVIDDKIKSPRKELTGEIAGVPVTINYGSPAVNDRVIYGDLVPYEKVWRTGANEATRITFGKDVKVGTEGEMLKAGTYSLFTLPVSKEEWTIIFNKVADQWGAYDYEDSSDAARVSGSSAASNKAERMDFVLAGNEVRFMWDDLMVSFPVDAASK